MPHYAKLNKNRYIKVGNIVDIKISNRKIIMVVLNIVFVAVFFFLYYLCDVQNIKQVAIVGIIQYIWMFTSWYIVTRNVMNVYLFFLGLSFCFYLGQPILYLLNIDTFNIMTIETSPFTLIQINKTLMFLLEAMALFHLGASFSIEKINNIKKVKINKKAITFVGAILFIVSVIPQMNYTLSSLIITLTEGYSNIFKSSITQGSGIEGGVPRFIAGFFEGSLLLLILGNKENNKWRKFWLWFTILNSLVMIASGQRGTNVLFLISIVFLYHYAIKPFTKRQILNFAWLPIGSLFAFSAISKLRNIGITNYSLVELSNLIVNDNFIISFLAEAGFTLIACTTVMVYSPSIVPFNDGATYFNSLFALVPNLFWEVNPAAQGGVDQVFKSYLFESSGIGSSFIIEAYYNFGVYGLIIMPIFGFLVGKLYFSMIKASQSNNYLVLYICVYLTPVFLWFVRSETITFWRNFGSHGFPYCFNTILFRIRKKEKLSSFKRNEI